MEASKLAEAVSIDELDSVGVNPRCPQPTAIINLDNGHKVAYEEFGCSTGSPMFYFHDSGSSRIECSFFHSSAKRFGIRLIAMDRPGIGQSSFYANANAQHIAEDVIALADCLNIDQFGVISLGKGGVFGLTLAHRYPHRVTQFISLAGVPGAVFSESGIKSWFASGLAEAVPPTISLLVRCKFALFHEEPRNLQKRLFKYLAAVDKDYLRMPRIRKALALDQSEMLRQGCRGLAQDLANCFRKLDFRLEEVRVPTTIWQGRSDSLSQRADCEFMVANMPAAHYHLVPNAGHFFFINSMDAVFSRLRGHTVPAHSLAA